MGEAFSLDITEFNIYPTQLSQPVGRFSMILLASGRAQWHVVLATISNCELFIGGGTGSKSPIGGQIRGGSYTLGTCAR